MLSRFKAQFYAPSPDTVLLIYGQSRDERFVDLRDLARIFGLDDTVVRARLTSEPMCRGVHRFTDTDTGRKVTVLRLDHAQMFICSIHPSRVKDRDRLYHYQLHFRAEAERVLDRLQPHEPPNLWSDTPPHRNRMFPDPGIVPSKDTRRAVSQLLRSYCRNTSVSHEAAWRDLYREVKYRLSVDLTARAENQGKERLDIAEEMGLMEKVYAIAYDLFASKGAVSASLQ